ncbi:hypothetical protein NZ698_01265 [Chryseobacterium sp. PBS4-4]|uniref:Right-handed parallel beta-helix repeat-containing protein n=1 Tax=Chryseobacterium edaphi TaxID=2976532 RepID=A0ABT2W0P2_9FLAO|nr:hypothetical protein [Chryseobacterium edaphi]MCU7615813.1 hypothetical protein [Chryseobacterium edaphi]
MKKNLSLHSLRAQLGISTASDSHLTFVGKKCFKTKQSSFKKTVLFTVLLLIGFAPQLKATDVYLASSTQGGLATNNGNSFATPKETIAYLNTIANGNLASTLNLHIYIKGNASYSWGVSGRIGIDDDFLIMGGFDPSSTGFYYNSTNNPVLYPTTFTITGMPTDGIFGLGSSVPNGFTLSGLNFVNATSGYLMKEDIGNASVNVYNFKSCRFTKFSPALWTNGNKTINIDNCYFDQNTGASGSALSLGNNATLNVTNSSFVGNSGGSVGGGAIASTGASTFTNTIFCGNTVTSSTFGGAAYGDWTNNMNKKTTFIGCTFSGNTSNNYGGAISKQSGILEVINCTFYNNKATQGGGAILFVDYAAGSTISGSKFYSNNVTTTAMNPGSMNSGGAIHLRPGGNPIDIKTSVFDSNFTGNGAGGFGGAVMFDNNYGSAASPLNIDGCTFINNKNSATLNTVGSDIGAYNGAGNSQINITNSAMQLAAPGTGVYRAFINNTTSPYKYFFGAGNTFGNTGGSLGTPTYACPTTICNIGTVGPIFN